MATLTAIPGLKATLTALPKQSPMPAEQAQPYIQIQEAVRRCDDYNENRKNGIVSQLEFVTHPASLPSEFVILYGNDWPARLVYGAAYLNALEWKLAGQKQSSCLYPIGQSFNELLQKLGQPTFSEFR